MPVSARACGTAWASGTACPNLITAIRCDRTGQLWFGTIGRGVSRFDGSHFTRFTTADGLAANGVCTLLEDRQGQLWVGTGEEGVSRFDGQEWDTFTTADGLGANEAWALLQDRQGHVWCGTGGGGLSRFDGQEWDTFTTADGLAANEVCTLLEDRQGQLWVGSGHRYNNPAGAGLSRYDGQEWTTYTTADGLVSDTVLSLAEDRQGQLWIGTDEGAHRWDGARLTPVAPLQGKKILAMVADLDGHLWFGTGADGICRFDGTHWATYTTADGLTNDQVSAIEPDQRGNLWFGTVSGASCYQQGTFAHFTTADGLAHNLVMSILEDRQGTLWVGTLSGVSRYNGTAFTALESLADWSVRAMVEDPQGTLWFGDRHTKGVMGYDGTQCTHLTAADGLGDNAVQCLYADSRGHLWFGFNSQTTGVTRYDGETWVTFTRPEGLVANSVEDMWEDRHGHLWFATYGGGVYGFDGQQFNAFTAEEGAAVDHVRRILEDRQGHLWFGTHDGAIRYDGRRFQKFKMKEGPGYDTMIPLLEDRRGHLWFATFGGGIICFDGRVFQTLSREDGLIHDHVHALAEDRQGQIWIGTEGGVTRYIPASIPPQVQLQAVIADQRYPMAHPIALSASQKLVAFEFEGCSWTTPPERLAYVYQLEGFDIDWRPVYTNRVEYQDLPVGDYTFQVKAVDRDLNYSEAVEVSVTIESDALVESLTATLGQRDAQEEFVGHSPALGAVKEALRQAAAVDLTVLILGETGTGKGLAARLLHEWSPRQSELLVQVTCGGMPEALIETELFGHEKGAFTGAISRRLGKVELAKGGTLFLDEIGDLPLASQVKLLRLLEERTFERVGGTQVHTAQVRVVAATNRDLRQMIRNDSFRQDLYFRLQGFEVVLPPLRQRQEDIPLLALYFIGAQAAHLDKPVTGLSRAAEEALVAYDWPGNVRELQHVMERAVVVCPGARIEADHLLLDPTRPAAPPTERVTLEEHERRYIQAVLDDTGGRVSGPQGAAKILGLKEGTLRARMKKLGVKRS